MVAETRYLPYSEERWTAGGTQPTDFTFTGQRAEGFGLMDYQARHYDPWLGRFISADTLVPEPGDPQAWNRFSYVLGNALRFTDPSGHQCAEGDMPCWEARWYEAHGYGQEGEGWIFTGEHRFRDIDAIRELTEDTGQLVRYLALFPKNNTKNGNLGVFISRAE